MTTTQPVPSEPEPARPSSTTSTTPPGRGLAVASLVIGVGSIVAAVSFLLFPLALLAGVVGVVLGAIALTRRRPGGGIDGQALAGLICSALALILAVTLAVRVGTWVSHNRRPLTHLSTCLTKASGDRAVRDCFVRFTNEVRG
jgi:membrane-bound ClpP family serine protease